MAPAEAAGTVNITVTTPGGTSATSASDQFTYDAVPAVSSLSVNAGPLTGGTTVVITGTNFTGATAVSFGGTAATSFTVNSATQITATAPADAAGTVNITVTTPGGTSATSASDQFTYFAVPIVSSLSVNAGPLAGGTTVVITGTNFTGATAVSFGGTAATSFTVNSATQITAVAPAESAGTVNITVTTPGGTSATSASDQFTYFAVPTVSSLSVTAGPLVGRHFGRHHRHQLYRRHGRVLRRHGGGQLHGQLRHANHGDIAGRSGGIRQHHRHHAGRHFCDVGERSVYLRRRAGRLFAERQLRAR